MKTKCFRCGGIAEVTVSFDSASFPDIELCDDCAQLLVKWPLRTNTER